MSEVPPVNEPVAPPPQFVAYPRAEALAFGSPEKLQALSDGYFGLNWAFVLAIVISFGSSFGSTFFLASVGFEGMIGLLVVASLIPVVLIAAITLPYTRKIAFGSNWSPKMGPICALLLGISSLVCVLAGFVVMQILAGAEIKKYGVQTRFLGYKKRDIRAKIAEMRGSGAEENPFQSYEGIL